MRFLIFCSDYRDENDNVKYELHPTFYNSVHSTVH